MINNDVRTALKDLVKKNKIKDLKGVHELIKELTAGTIQTLLEEELDDDLGYAKHDYQNKQTDNSRNGYSKKTLDSSLGSFEVGIPRDRNGEFEPTIVKKYQTDISEIEEKIIFLFSQGTSTRDIQKTMHEIYGINVDDTKVSRITDKILPLIKEWQQRPLEPVYAMIMLDAIQYSVREDGMVVKKSAYIVIGTDLEGKKDVLGIWLGASESAKYWLSVLNELKNRGVEDIFIASVDGLSGFIQAINAAFPQTEVQRCIIHQIRSSTKYIAYKDIKAFMKDLKPVYKAASEELGRDALEELDEKWGSKYPASIKSWKDNWNELSTFFKYPPEIRILIYTTNAIENYNRQLRKVTKTKGAFVSDDALMKMLYLATMNIVKKWTMPIRNWPQIMSQLYIYFGERLEKRL